MNHPFEQTYQQAVIEMNGSRWNRALELVEACPSENQVQKRRIAHLKVQILMRQGEFAEAENQLKEIERLLGPHIALLSDLCCCLYQQGKMMLFRQKINELAARLQSVRPLLTPERLGRTCVILGKFLEEEGRIEEALSLYIEAKDIFQALEDPHWHYTTLAQILRLRIDTGIRKDVPAYYRELLTMAQKDRDLFLDVEVQHALVLAEVELLGPEQAWLRIRQLTEGKLLSRLDENLIFFDFCAATLCRTGAVLEESLSFLQTEIHLESMGPFEEHIARLMAHCQTRHTNNTTFGESTHWPELPLESGEMSVACYLRLHCLHLRIDPESAASAHIRKRLAVLLQSLPEKSQSLWIKSCEPLQTSSPLVLELNPASGKVKSKAVEISLGRRRTFLSILCLFEASSSLPLDEVTRRMWKTEFCPNDYDRLRMTVNRLNRLLFDLTGRDKLIQITKESLSLAADIRIRLSP